MKPPKPATPQYKYPRLIRPTLASDLPPDTLATLDPELNLLRVNVDYINHLSEADRREVLRTHERRIPLATYFRLAA
jgi:hypothetical protein